MMSFRLKIVYNEIVPQKGKSVKREVDRKMYLEKIKIAGLCSMENTVEPILYITDDAATAKRLRDAGEAVLVHLHPGNSNQDFSQFLFAVEQPEDLDAEYVEKVYRRLKGLPWDILETDRCLVRETITEDVEDFYRIYSVPSITEHMDDLYPEVEQEKQYVRDYIEKVYTFFEFGVWTVVEKATGTVIGRAGLSYREGFEEPELGFVIGVPWQRRGYAREVCEAILQYGNEVLGFEAIQALVEPQNEASLSLCGKLGMKPVESVSIKGKEYTRLIYQMQTVKA